MVPNTLPSGAVQPETGAPVANSLGLPAVRIKVDIDELIGAVRDGTAQVVFTGSHMTVTRRDRGVVISIGRGNKLEVNGQHGHLLREHNPTGTLIDTRNACLHRLLG